MPTMKEKPMDGELLKMMEVCQLELLKMRNPNVLMQKLLVLKMQPLKKARRDSLDIATVAIE